MTIATTATTENATRGIANGAIEAIDATTPSSGGAIANGSALPSGEVVDAFGTLTRVIEQWPEQMQRVPASWIYRAVQRADVNAAIERVGRIESYPF